MNFFTNAIKDAAPMPTYTFPTPDPVTTALAAKDVALAQAKLALTDAINEFTTNLNDIDKGMTSIAVDLQQLETVKEGLLADQTVLTADRVHVVSLLDEMNKALAVVSPPTTTGTTITYSGNTTTGTNTVDASTLADVQTTPTV